MSFFNYIRKSSKINIIYNIIAICILLFFSLFFLKSNCVPKVYGDEYGYWSAGGWIIGYDWGQISRLNGYYGWGYGVILGLILKLPISSTACYKIAIFVNSFFLILIFLIAYFLINNLFIKRNLKEYELTIFALWATIGASTLYYVNYTMCEVFLSLLYWILISLAYKLLNDFSITNRILYWCILALLLYTHMRTIPIFIFSVFYYLILLLRRKEKIVWIKVGVVLIFIVLIVIFGLIVKEMYQSSYVSGPFVSDLKSNIETNNANGISAGVGSLVYAFSLNGISNTIFSFFGRIYSSCISSFLMVLMFSYLLLLQLKKKNINNIFFLYIFLNYIGMLAISAVISAGRIDERFDYLTYGRYHEFIMGPILISGVYLFINEFSRNDINIKKMLSVISIIGFVIAKLIEKRQTYMADMGNAFCHSVWTFFGANILGLNKGTMLLPMIFIAIIIVLTFYGVNKLGYKVSDCLKIIAVIGIITNITMCIYSYNKVDMGWANDLGKRACEFEYDLCNKKLEYYYIVNDDILLSELYQFLLKDKSVNIIYNINEYLKIRGNDTVLLVGYKNNQTNYTKKLNYLGYYKWVNAWN